MSSSTTFCCLRTSIKRYQTRSYILMLLLVTFFITIIFDVIFTGSIRATIFPLESLSCYRSDNLESYPDISYANVRKGKTIFFHETSCKSYERGKTVLTSRQACAIESAAKMNPNFDVSVLFTSPGVFINNDSESDRFIKALFSYPNVRFYHINYSNYTKGTLVQYLYQNRKIENSYYAISHASDVLRYLTLWRFGGIYLDLDVIVMKPMGDLPENYAGAESNTNVAAGVMNFSPDGLGHFLAEECLIDLSEHFSGYDWGNNGPGVITRLLRKLCKVNSAKEMMNKTCRGFTIYPPKYFYPIPWWNWTMYFEEKYTDNVFKKIKDSYVVHVWNKHSYTNKIPVYKRVPYILLAEKYCPKVFSECRTHF